MKVGVITFPGSNCDADLRYVLAAMGHQVVSLWHKDTDLQGCDWIGMPGGFAHGDYLRTGAIARFSPIMHSVASFAAAGGPVLGICNGFQILTEAGLLPGALLRNKGMHYICDNIYLRPASTALVGLAQRPYKIPIAHGEGNYTCDASTLQRLQEGGQLIFQYCNAEGNITDSANPNGSLGNIAGISNARGNVIGMMPHPERAADPLLGNTDGLEVLQALLQHSLQRA